MPKTVTPFTSQFVQHTTTLSYAEVASRLESQVNKAGSTDMLARLAATSIMNEVELGAVVNQVTGQHDFLYFSEIHFDKMLQRFSNGEEQPQLTVYTIGNPLIAQGVLKRNREAAYYIPPRLVVAENEDRSGTTVSYHLPSSAMQVTAIDGDEILRERLRDLDSKLEHLVQRITRVEV